MQSQGASANIYELLRHIQSGSLPCRDFIDLIMALAPEHKPPPPQPPIKAAVYRGGGVRVTTYLGANQVLADQGYYDGIDHVIGASGGGIIAFLAALGFSPDQLNQWVQYLHYFDLADVRQSALGGYYASSRFSKVWDALIFGGSYEGHTIRQWAESLLTFVLGYPDATFRDLERTRQSNPALKDLHLVVCRVNPSKGQSREVALGADTYPNVKLSDALCATLAYPGAFKPVHIPGIGYCADGGLVHNFPMKKADCVSMCDPHYDLMPARIPGKDYSETPLFNPCAVGFSVERDAIPSPVKREDEQHPYQHKKWHLGHMVKTITRYGLGALKAESFRNTFDTHPDTCVRVPDCGIKTLQLNLKRTDKVRMIENGKRATSEWLQKHKNMAVPYDGGYNTEPYSERIHHRSDYASYERQISIYMHALLDELERMDGLPKQTNLFLNLRILNKAYHLKYLINDVFDHIPNPEQALTVTWQMCLQDRARKKNAIHQHRNRLNAICDPARFKAMIKALIFSDSIDATQKLRRYIFGNPSMMRVICLEDQDNLLCWIARFAPTLMPGFCGLIQEIYDRDYQQCSKKSSVLEMLNAMSPALLSCANHSRQGEGVPICLDLGCNPFLKDGQAKSPLHHAIDAHCIDGVIQYLKYFQTHAWRLDGLNDNGTLWQYMINAWFNHPEYFRRLMDESGDALRYFIQQTPLDEAGITPLEALTILNQDRLWNGFCDLCFPDNGIDFITCRDNRVRKEIQADADSVELDLAQAAPPFVPQYDSLAPQEEDVQLCTNAFSGLSLR